MNEEKDSVSIYDEAEINEELPQSEDMTPDEVQEKEEEWEVSTMSESPKDKLERVGVKEKSDGKILTIKEVGFTRPRFKDQNGERIPPKKTLNGDKEFYPGKLKIKFEEDNLVEYYPSFKYFVSPDGKVGNLAKIHRGGEGAITAIFNLAVVKMGLVAAEVSDQDFYDWMIGKKVKIKVVSDADKGNSKYLGKAWFRNDIVSFED